VLTDAARTDAGTPPLRRRVVAEGLGTGVLATVVVGSGAAAERLSPGDTGLQLLENALATALGLTVLVLVVGSVSGAHLNPVVSLADWAVGRRRRTGLPGSEVAAYAGVQVAAALLGAVVANLMFDVPAGWATIDRTGWRLWLGEVVATAGLVTLVLALARTGRTAVAAPAVGAYIGAAYWFTSSTAFANPALTLGRTVTDSFSGIAPSSVPGFVGAQLVGGALGVLAARVLYPDVVETAGDVVVRPSALSDASGGTDR
jgi:glycerol uptake facilitator-like aquaporin